MQHVWKILTAIIIFGLVSLGISLLMGQSCAVPKHITAKAEDVIAIKSVLKAQEAAWNSGDIEGFMQGYVNSEALRFASGGDIETGWEPTLQRYLRRYPDRATMGQLVFSDMDVDVLSGNDALVFGRWKLIRDNDAPHGLFTLHMKRVEGDWVVVSDHTSSGG